MAMPLSGCRSRSLPHEVTTGAVGQTEIAHQNVKMRAVGSLQCLGHTAGSFHNKSRGLQEPLQQQSCVRMIFHDEQTQNLISRRHIPPIDRPRRLLVGKPPAVRS